MIVKKIKAKGISLLCVYRETGAGERKWLREIEIVIVLIEMEAINGINSVGSIPYIN